MYFYNSEIRLFITCNNMTDGTVCAKASEPLLYTLDQCFSSGAAMLAKCTATLCI
jgi:hypothetical protein